MDFEKNEHFSIEQDVEGWVMEKCQEWRDHFDSNY